ncbi:MAG: lipopolysaccharide biosynthesis protein [Acidimicrobiia bacterium]|nr:lipopolysaccharide biosynthesis protein [Acidimicrobiia bacterium]
MVVPGDPEESLDSRGASSSHTAGHAVKGVAWSLVGFGSNGVGQFVVLAVLARFLTAYDFGVVSAAVVIVSLGQLFTESGVGPAVVQRKDLTDEHIRTAYALAIVSGIGMTIVVALAAPLVADIFSMPELTRVTQVLALTFAFQGLSIVAQSLMQRGLEFRKIALAEAASFFVGFAGVGLGMAFAGAGVWTLVGAQLAQVALLGLLVVVIHPHPRGWRIRRNEARELLAFGGGMTVGRAFNFVAVQGDNAVVGARMNATSLGIYGRAYQLAVTPALLLGQVIDRVSFPLIAGFQDDRDRVGRAYLRGVALVALATGPASVLAVVCAPEIIRIVLGPGWGEVVVPFQIFSIGLLCRTSYKISDSLARAMGTVYRRAWRQAVYAVAVVSGAIIGSLYGLAWVAIGVLGAIVLNYVLMADLSIRTIGGSWRKFFVRQTHGVVLAVLAAAVSIPVATSLRAVGLGPILVLLGTSCAALLICIAAIIVTRMRLLGEDGPWMIDLLRMHSPKPIRAMLGNDGTGTR